MPTQITILGLGQIGGSIGMALGKIKTPLLRVGYDIDSSAERAAESTGAVDQIKNLTAAVREADIILLCLPLGELRATVQKISLHLKKNAILIDTAPIKSPVVGWMKEYLPADRFYIGLVPAVTMEALVELETGFKSARSDLFRNTVMIVDAPPGTPAEVEQLAINLARLLGAKPMLADMAESDGIMTSIHILPQLTAAALLDATIDQPGWAEGRKIAGRPFTTVTGGLAYYDDPASLKTAVLANRSIVMHALDKMMAALMEMRDEIEKGDEQGIGDRFDQAFSARERWLTERGVAEWLKEGGDALDLPELGEQVLQTLFGTRMIDRIKKKK